MQKTPKALRLHIGIFGRRNVGKSSILNKLTGQETSIVSDFAGTTTDPVEKTMELLPLGPVVFVDTAGVDDEGCLGKMRIEKTKQVLKRTDLAILVTAADQWGRFEDELLEQFSMLKIPVIAVFNKTDLAKPSQQELEAIQAKAKICLTSVTDNTGINELRKLIIATAPEDYFTSEKILSDLVGKGQTVVLVVPVDKEAPKGRLILPQVQSIRDLLDANAVAAVCQDTELKGTLEMFKEKPALVVTDSQAFAQVSADTPDDILMTSFSILFARFKADLLDMTLGAMAIKNLKPGDTVMIAESCTHHPIEDDIGTIKIPKMLNRFVGGQIHFDHVRGHDWPDDLSKYKLIIHCGACVWNKRAMLSRILTAKQANVPITNYGLAIAYSLGIFERALRPFPAVWEAYRQQSEK